MLAPSIVIILALLLACAILLVSLFLMFADGAKVYENPELIRDYHSDMNERGKNACFTQ